MTSSNAVISAPNSVQRALPSVIDPLELSERSDSSGDSPVVEVELVRVAAAWITDRIASTLKRGAQEVGEYVLKTFFMDDPAFARSRDPQKNASFRVLAEKCGTPELPVSRTWLNNAVGIALVIRQLPKNARAFRLLPPSYQQTLLPLRDPIKVEMIAKHTATRELTFRQLRCLVAEERMKEHHQRKPVPRILKILNRSAKILSPNNGGVSEEIGQLAENQRRRARRLVEDLTRTLQELASELDRSRQSTDTFDLTNE